MDNKDRLIVAQNCNSATAQVMAALVNNGIFTYDVVRGKKSLCCTRITHTERIRCGNDLRNMPLVCCEI